eukprot:TRINITY_DN10220_c0_g1_i1.p1 TRINITY_DN10220_c0_g1~~TRINITY_DN10220_c0_g1_i1.p1  ORF type:complete len:105 (+),score=5.18 TRINITY_DN10220_c0_g1_i1:40-354(+)
MLGSCMERKRSVSESLPKSCHIASLSALLCAALLLRLYASVYLMRNANSSSVMLLHSIVFLIIFATSVCAILHIAVSYTHLRAHETRHDLVCRLLLEKKKKKKK